MVPHSYLVCHQMELESTVSQLEEADSKASSLGKQVAKLEGQLADSQEMLQEETRQKLAALSKLRGTEEKAESIQDQLEEEEEARRSLENKISQLNIQVNISQLNIQVNIVINIQLNLSRLNIQLNLGRLSIW